MKDNKKITIGIIALILAGLIVVALLVGLSANKSNNSLKKLLDLGMKYLEDGAFDDAIAEFEKAIGIDPNDLGGYEGAIKANIGAGDEAIAIPDYYLARKYFDRASELVEIASQKIDDGTLDSKKVATVSTQMTAQSVDDCKALLGTLKTNIKDKISLLPPVDTENDSALSGDGSNNNGENSSDNDISNTESGDAGSNNGAEEIGTFSDFIEAVDYELLTGPRPYVVSYSLYKKLYGPTIDIFERNIDKYENNVSGDDAIALCRIYRKMWSMYADTNQMDKAKVLYEKWISLSQECGNESEWNPSCDTDEWGRVTYGFGNENEYSDNSNRPTAINGYGNYNTLVFDGEGRVIHEENQNSSTDYEYSGNTVKMTTTNLGHVSEDEYFIDEATGVVSGGHIN